MATKAQTGTLIEPSGTRARLRRFWDRLAQMYRADQERQEMCRLDDRELRDFGANRLDVQREMQRPLWHLPPMA